MRDPATAAKLSGLLRLCRGCGQSLAGHEFALFASMIAREREIPRLHEFFQLSAQHNWERLAKFQEWDGSCDSTQAFALKCPDGTVQIVILKDFFDPFTPAELYTQARLDPKEATTATNLVPAENWRVF